MFDGCDAGAFGHFCLGGLLIIDRFGMSLLCATSFALLFLRFFFAINLTLL